MPNNLPTEAGQCDPSLQRNPDGEAKKVALIDAINQIFTLFRLNYHNQYLKAFGNSDELHEVKRLWLEMLRHFEPEVLLRAAKSVIESSEYLPTLRSMIHHCERVSARVPLPDAHSAYIEACRAPSPKASQNWSHAAVYHAGQKCDWFFLQSSSEAVAYPVFRKIYAEICDQVRLGQALPMPAVATEATDQEPALAPEENQMRLTKLRTQLDI